MKTLQIDIRVLHSVNERLDLLVLLFALLSKRGLVHVDLAREADEECATVVFDGNAARYDYSPAFGGIRQPVDQLRLE